jgi:hypothetical protein
MQWRIIAGSQLPVASDRLPGKSEEPFNAENVRSGAKGKRTLTTKDTKVHEGLGDGILVGDADGVGNDPESPAMPAG